MINVRQKWPCVWMSVARDLAEKSNDPRLKVAAIVVPDDNTSILGIGYNGGPKGLYNDPLSLEPGASGFTHAEANCLIKCPFYHVRKKHMYVTHSPCVDCSRLIINAEISVVVYGELYRDVSGIDLLKEAGINVMSIEDAILIA